MEDFTFDTYGVSVKEQELSLLDRYRDKLQIAFHGFRQYLDEYQTDIVFNKANDLPLKITANAGSGKTQCLLAKALKMVIQDKIYPGSIVLITFTNKAANEIRERYIKFFKNFLTEAEMMDVSLPHMSTIHSFACSILYKMFGIRRTILTEYHALKLLKSIILEVLKVKKVDAKFVKNIYEVIGEIYSNNELHYFCLPCFNLNGTLREVLKTENILKEEFNYLQQWDFFSNTGISKWLAGEGVEISPELREKVVINYTTKTQLTVNNFVEILKLFVEKKYISNTMDFSDMRMIPFLILNQYPQLKRDIWKEYKYFIIDEAQDMNTLDFSLAVTCDQDSYERFLEV